MAVITKSIGATARDYSTITLWEAALGGAAGGGGNDAVGECYDDAAFDENVAIDDGTPSSITLTVATGEEHDGTAGTGARIVRTAATTSLFSVTVAAVVEKLEIDANKQSNASNGVLVNLPSFNVTRTLKRLIVHGYLTSSGTVDGVHLHQKATMMNSLVYNIDSQASGSAYCFGVNVAAGAVNPSTLLNTTVHNVNKNGTGVCVGVALNDVANNTIKNVMCTDTVNIGAGPDDDLPTSVSSAAVDYNLSSDASATGGNSLTSKAAGNQYVSNVEDSEDLHLKTGANAIDAGNDLGTTPADIEFDIDGFDRDTAAVTWDMGGHEFVAAGNPWNYYANQQVAV